MKKSIIVIIAICGSVGAHAQKIKQENIPLVVKESFQKLYPDVVSYKWELEEGEYEVSFKKNDQKTELKFSSDGKLIETEKELGSANDLPKEILAALKAQYANYSVKDAEKITTTQNEILYEVEVKATDGTKQELVFNENGKLLKTKPVASREKEEEKEGKNHKKRH